MENPHNSPALVMPGELIVGNHDSLTIFANEPQNQLRFASKTIAEIALHSTEDLELILKQIMLEIDTIQVSSIRSERGSFTLFRAGERMKLVRKYEDMYKSINDMTLALQLQQATLIKENSRLRSIEPVLLECSTAFENHIYVAESLIQELNVRSHLSNQQTTFLSDEMVAWQSRLERKLEDIRISHTVSMQNIAQVKAMISNNQKIIDRIVSAVTNTIPIWRNQVSLSLNIEKLKSELLVQNRIASTVNQSLERTSKELRKGKTDTSFDRDKLNEINQALYNALGILLSCEQKCAEAKQAFSPNTTKES